MKRRSHKLLLVLTMFVTILVTTAFVSAEGEFAGGDGSVANPYQITTKEHLDNIRNYPDANFKLMNNIIYEESGWMPIDELSGTLDGNGYAIENLYLNSSGSGYEGFIRTITDSGVVKNLHMKNINYISSSDAGVIAYTNNGRIDNCTVSGSIELKNSSANLHVGGIVNTNSGIIQNCANFAYMTMSGESETSLAGIAETNDGVITNCINAGTFNMGISGRSNQRNIAAGISVTSNGTIQNCANLNGPGSQELRGAKGFFGIVYVNQGKIENTVNAIGTATSNIVILDDPGIYNLPLESIDVENYTSNPIAIDYLSRFKFGQNVKKLKSQGYTYKNTQVSWTAVPGAVKYILYRGETTVEFDELISGETPIAEIEGNQDSCSYIDSKDISGDPGIRYYYRVAPVYQYDDVTFIGASSRVTTTTVVNTSSASNSTDTMGPYVEDVIIEDKVVYKPGALNIRVKASDNESPIVKVEIFLYGAKGLDPSQIHSYTMLCEIADGNFGTNMDRVFSIPVEQQGVTAAVNDKYHLDFIRITDAAGNMTLLNASILDPSIVYVEDEFDVEFRGNLSNPHVPRQLEIMEEGKTVILTIDEASKGVLKKEVLDIIKGKDKTIVVYVDDQGSAQWVFYGKDITGETKDLKLTAKINKVNGKILGLNSDILEMIYEDNGQLPGKVNFRVKSDYLSTIYKVNSSFFLYYKNGKKVELENTACKAIREGSAYWCYVDLSHNSTFYLTGEAAKTSEIIETPADGGDSVTPQPTPGPSDPAHQCVFEKVITKATTTKNGKIEMKCGCGVVESTTVINKASGTKLKVSSYLYNGKKKTSPKIIVKDSKGKIIGSKHYTITKPKKALKEIGNYTYTVKFKGDQYKGTKKLVLTIKPAKPTIKAPKAAKKDITVKWKGVKKAHATGYQVMVATDKKFTKNVKQSFVKGYGKTSYKMTKLNTKKTYYIKVRTYKTVKGVKIYSDWSKVKTCKTK